MKHLTIQNLGPLIEVDIEFGNLTLFVEPNGCGKSLVLESLKLVRDRDSVIETLDKYNYIIGQFQEDTYIISL